MALFSDDWFIWLSGQILLGFIILQWFFIIHDLAHRSLFHSPTTSAIFGHLASLFCLIPYYSWKKVHHAHHKRTGWQEKDPTVPDFGIEDLSPFMIRVIDFRWKYWIPVFAFSYCLSIFYNLKKLFGLYPKDKAKITFSILFLVVSYSLIIYFVGGLLFIKIFVLAFFLFLFISDPLLISQHTHLNSIEDNDHELRLATYQAGFIQPYGQVSKTNRKILVLEFPKPWGTSSISICTDVPFGQTARNP